MSVLMAVGLVWAGLCVGFVVGAVWVSLFAERRIAVLEDDLAALDHNRFIKQEAVEAETELALGDER